VQFYLPGIDGTGLAAASQFNLLSQDFILSCLTVPPSNRDTFEELLERCVAHITSIAAEIPPTRPIYLWGESFGGILALAIGAAAPECVDRIVVVNPATSFPESPWASVRHLGINADCRWLMLCLSTDCQVQHPPATKPVGGDSPAGGGLAPFRDVWCRDSTYCMNDKHE
jgi:pimeloyl-ACP methyl ester carboxylesterase